MSDLNITGTLTLVQTDYDSLVAWSEKIPTPILYSIIALFSLLIIYGIVRNYYNIIKELFE